MSNLTVENVKSSMLNGVAYDENAHSLYAIFNDNFVYEYKEVPLEVYNNLLIASSIGKYMHSDVFKKYSSTFLGSTNDPKIQQLLSITPV